MIVTKSFDMKQIPAMYWKAKDQNTKVMFGLIKCSGAYLIYLDIWPPKANKGFFHRNIPVR